MFPIENGKTFPIENRKTFPIENGKTFPIENRKILFVGYILYLSKNLCGTED